MKAIASKITNIVKKTPYNKCTQVLILPASLWMHHVSAASPELQPDFSPPVHTPYGFPTHTHTLYKLYNTCSTITLYTIYTPLFKIYQASMVPHSPQYTPHPTSHSCPLPAEPPHGTNKTETKPFVRYFFNSVLFVKHFSQCALLKLR